MTPDPQPYDTAASGPVIRAQLPSTLAAPRHARAAVRQALAAWGLDALAGDAELIASELVANAAEHAAGTAIGLSIRQHHAPGGRRGIACEITDTSPRLPVRQPIRPDRERGRGLTIVTALATTSGVTARPGGKTTWFTLTTQADPARSIQHTEPEPELEPGA